MRKIVKWVKKKWLYILVALAGAAITPSAIQAAYEFRGYQAFGSEYLLIPLFILVVALGEGFVETVKEVMHNENEMEDEPGGGTEDGREQSGLSAHR